MLVACLLVACYLLLACYLDLRGEGCSNIWHMLSSVSTLVQGVQGVQGREVGTRPPILGSGNTRKHVLEVNWMVISGYLPLQRAHNG